MLIRKPPDIRSSEITPESVYFSRRALLQAAGFAGAGTLLSGALAADEGIPVKHRRLAGVRKSPFSTKDAPNTFEEVTGYNNFYEFGTGKEDPAAESGRFRPKPWKVKIDGEAEVTGTVDYDSIVKPHALEERIYRFRCVEAWSMVVPWVGIPLRDVLTRYKPTSKAK